MDVRVRVRVCARARVCVCVCVCGTYSMDGDLTQVTGPPSYKALRETKR
jgi:hypothetical protein